MSFRADLAAVAAVLAAQSAWAAEGVERMPTPAETVFAYPRPAYRAHLGGTVSFDCAIEPTGKPRSCDVVSESPAGHDFDKAARKLVAYMRFGEAPAPYRARFTIDFEPPQAEKWPTYLHMPSGEDIRSLWPAGMTGEIDVACALGKDATLSDCEVVEPFPVSDDLQRAAVESMRLFRFSPGSLRGEPVPAFVIVPFRFSAP